MPNESSICPDCGCKLLRGSKDRAKRNPDTMYRCACCGYTSAGTSPHPDTSARVGNIKAMLEPTSPWPKEFTGNEKATIWNYIQAKTIPIDEDGTVTFKVLFGEYEVNTETFKVARDGDDITLTRVVV